jgi:hypothetical protein
VSSLFPAQVRDQVYEEREEQEKKRLSNQFPGDGKANLFNGDDVEANRKSRPIAEKFEHTTILFADLAGFTKWSSTRRPEEVFELLETLYCAFGMCFSVNAQIFPLTYVHSQHSLLSSFNFGRRNCVASESV